MLNQNNQNEVLNKLATSYAEGNAQSMIDLFEELRGFVKARSIRASQKAESHNVFIPSVDFESAFNLSIWQSAKEYDGSSHFMQRLRTYMGLREADVWRSYRTIKEKKPTYEKGQSIYLNETINEEGDTLGDIILAKFADESPEDKHCRVDSLDGVVTMIEEFKEYNERFYLVIKALSGGADNDKIAKVLGEVAYNGKVRSVVFRARAAFKVFLQDKTNVANIF